MNDSHETNRLVFSTLQELNERIEERGFDISYQDKYGILVEHLGKLKPLSSKDYISTSCHTFSLGISPPEGCVLAFVKDLSEIDFFHDSENAKTFCDVILRLVDNLFPEGNLRDESRYANQAAWGFSSSSNRPSLTHIKKAKSQIYDGLIENLVYAKQVKLALKLYSLFSTTYTIYTERMLKALHKIMWDNYTRSAPDHSVFSELNQKELIMLEIMISEHMTDVAVSCKNAILRMIESMPAEQKLTYFSADEICSLQQCDTEKKLSDWLGKNNQSHYHQIYQILDAFQIAKIDTDDLRYHASVLNLEYKAYLQALVILGSSSPYSATKVFRLQLEELLEQIHIRENILNNAQVDAFSDLTAEELKELVISYLNDGYTYGLAHEKTLLSILINENDASSQDRLVEYAYQKIQSNDKLLRQIATGEKIIRFFPKSSSFSGDFTGFVVSQIKAVERYLKEYLVQFYPDCIYKNPNKPYAFKISFLSEAWDSLTADNLSGNMRTPSNILCTKEERPPVLECGPAYYALEYALGRKDKLPCIFQNGSHNLYRRWISDVRNGHLHIHEIESVQEAKKIREKTAFWFLSLVLSLNALKR